MATVIGMDEAGYGPVLGPLTVGAAAFEVPDADGDLWELFGSAVRRTRSGPPGGLLVADSKYVYAGGRGLDDLERAVLAFLRTDGGRPPESFHGLTQRLCGKDAPACSDPWWSDTPLPVRATAHGVESAATALAAARPRVRFLGLAARVVAPGPFNDLVARHRNKAILLFQQNMSLIDEMAARFGGDLAFFIDKHGGRHYYAPLLANNFFGRPLRTLRESPRASSYEVALPGRTLRFAFIEKADELHFPAALASMACKYLRELFMLCFNAYWCERVGGLRPTAGYAEDSARFIAAIRPHFRDGDEHRTVRLR